MVDNAIFNLVPNDEEEEFVLEFGELTNVGRGGTRDFNELENRPQYNGETMTGETNIPEVPSKVSDLDNDSNYQTGAEVQTAIETAIGGIEIPTKTSDLTNDGSDGTSTYVEADDLAAVATSGDYNDLSNKPTIPTDTTYSAGNAITIDENDNNRIDAAIYPADYFTASASQNGNGTIFSLNNTMAATLKNVELYGDTEQNAYSGKNLVSFSTILPTRCTYTESNGVYSITATGDSPSIRFALANNIPAGTYTWSSTISGWTISPRATDGSSLGVNSAEATHTITISADMGYISFFSSATSGSVVTLDLSTFQIESGSTATSYEPYVGGIPSPNPEYPQDVNVVTGRQQINVSGKNLLDTEYSKVKSVPGNTSSGRTWDDTEKTMEYNGITYKFNEDGTITVSGSTGSSPSFLILNGPIENLQEGSDYYMSGCPAGGSAASYSLRLYTTASTYTPETGNGLAFTYGEQPFIRINISADIVADDLVFKPMIVNSSDAGDEFVPFQGYESYEINLGKNLLDASTNVEGKRLDASGNLINDGEYFTTDFIKVSPSTEYTYSRYASGGGSTALCTWKADGTFIERIWWGGVSNIPATSFSFTTGPDVGLIKICDIKTLSNLQLELGSTSSSYAPYSTPIELCKIGDYQDYIYKSGDDWYLHKATGGQDITSIFSLYSSAGAGYIGGIKNASDMKANSRDNGFCNKLTPIYSPSGAVTEGITFGAGSTNQNIYIILQSSRIPDNTIGGWNTYLSSNPFIVYYPLATPTDTEITDVNLLNQLNALGSGKSYLDITDFSVTASGTNLPAILDVEVFDNSLAGMSGAIETKQDKLIAGENITIENNIISTNDAVTVEQVNATIDAINTALSTNIPHIGA